MLLRTLGKFRDKHDVVVVLKGRQKGDDVRVLQLGVQAQLALHLVPVQRRQAQLAVRFEGHRGAALAAGGAVQGGCFTLVELTLQAETGHRPALGGGGGAEVGERVGVGWGGYTPRDHPSPTPPPLHPPAAALHGWGEVGGHVDRVLARRLSVHERRMVREERQAQQPRAPPGADAAASHD